MSSTPLQDPIRLDAGVLLIAWDRDRPGDGSATSVDTGARGTAVARLEPHGSATTLSAFSCMRHGTGEGGAPAGRRHYLLARFPVPHLDTARAVLLEGEDAPRRISTGSSGVDRLDAAAISQALLDGLDGSARARLVGWFLRFCGGLNSTKPGSHGATLGSPATRLGSRAATLGSRAATLGSRAATLGSRAATLGRALLAGASAHTAEVTGAAVVGAEHVLLGAGLPSALGPARFVATIAASGIRLSRVPRPPGSSPWIAVETRALRGCEICVVGCQDGLVTLRLPRSGVPALDLLAWMRTHADDRGEKLDGVLTALHPLATKDPTVRALSVELQLRFPRRRRASLDAAAPVAAELRIAPCDATGGVFLSGWLDDPHGLLASATLTTRPGRRTRVTLDAHRYASRHAITRCEELGRTPSRTDLGFVSHVPGSGHPEPHSLQPHLELRLHSGSRIRLVPALQTLDAAVAKTAVLSSVPAEQIDAPMMERCIRPAVAALHAEHLSRERVAEVAELGRAPRRPGVSIVIPLYRNIDYLKTQLAALALDPDLDDIEIVLVLDSPEIAGALKHLIDGLTRCCPLPLRLVVMRENFGYAAACNAGAGVARGRALLMLNSDVLPRSPGWLGHLRRGLAQDGVAAVGARLLFDDGSLQHAGLYFEETPSGRWLNRHYFKGFPGEHPGALVPGEVPAVTGACLLVTSAAFHGVGGYCEDYVFGDYEDSDLCLRLRSDGGRILYEPRAVLYHLERRSIALHSGYVQSAAWLYNCIRHQQRWGEDLRALMVRFGAGTTSVRRIPCPSPGDRTVDGAARSGAA